MGIRHVFMLVAALAIPVGVSAGEITFPSVVVPVNPDPPAPATDTPAVTIDEGVIFAVQGDEPFVLLSSPQGLVTIAHDPGPVRVRGKFADDTSRIETRVLASKYLAFVDAVAGAAGTVELIAIPCGLSESSQITRRIVRVGHAPLPPPDVNPPPGPVPVPDPALKGMRVILVTDGARPATREQLAVLNSTRIVEYLNTHCVKGAKGQPEWRKWDVRVAFGEGESKALRELWESSKPHFGTGPQIVIAVDGQATVFDLPQSEADALALLRSKGGD